MVLVPYSQIQRSYKTLKSTITSVQAAQSDLKHPIPAVARDHNSHATPDICSPSIKMKPSKTNKLKQTLLRPRPLNAPLTTISNPYHNSNRSDVNPPSTPVQIKPGLQPSLDAQKRATDEMWVGHRMRHPKSSYARIWVQNVNGLNINFNFNPYLEHLEFIKRYSISLLAITETHLNNQNSYVHENIQVSHKKIHPEGHVLLTNTPTTTYEDTRQTGGVLMATQNRLSSRYAGGGSDPGGRYAWMDFFGKDTFLRIYTVYRVCSSSDNRAGDNQAWTIQREWLKLKGIHTDPRTQVLHDLKKAIQTDILKKRQILVLGDFNENVLNPSSAGVQSMKSAGLINVLESNIMITQSTRSHSRGSHVIDGVWATPYIQEKIMACGLAPFNFVYPSDHRGIFIDIDILEILDAREIDITPPPYRRLKCTIPKRVDTYCKEVQTKWMNHKMKEKINKLEDMSTLLHFPEIKESFIKYVNQYDSEISGIMSSSERNCCAVSRHCTHLFTPKLKKILRTKRQLHQQLQKHMKLSISIKSSNNLRTLKELQQKVKSANLELREYTKSQREQRDAFIEERAADITKKRGLGKSKVASIVKNLKHIERQMEDARKIRNVLKPGSKTRTDFVMIPALSQYSTEQQSSSGFDFLNIETIWPRLQVANGKDITEWYNVENPVQVEQLILEALQKHFSQASDTLVTSPKWREILSSKEGQDSLLNGTFEWDDTVPGDFRELLTTFRKPDNAQNPEITFELNYEAFRQFVKNSKEKTSTSPSSRHYGHYKSLLDGAPDILEDIFRLMNLSVKTGVFLTRYQKTLTTLICKESGTPYLHRFRPIHIIEAELQFISKSIWAKKMIRTAEQNKNITDAQYGGRHGRQAQSSVLNTILYYDIHRQLRKDYTSNDDDMKANFDREIPHYVAAESRSLGMSHEAGQFLIQATSSQEYFIRTPNGVSEQSYKFEENRPIWGLGQGVGWAGACWQVTASTISKCMNRNCVGIYLCCPEGDVTVEKLMDFFIDDTKKVCNQIKHGMTLRDQTEYNMQKHTYYIAATGGSLALDKCTWYQIIFSFDSNGDPYILNKVQMPGEIDVFKNFEGEKVRIRRLEYDEAHRSLGYFVSPDGSSDAHFEFTKDLVHKWSSRVKSSRLNSSQILKSYETVLKRQLLYRSVATSFSHRQCDSLMKLINPILLHAANLNEHFPRSIMEAGEEYAGFNWAHLYDMHCQEKLQFLMMHLRKKDTTGKLLQISMKFTQLQLGVESNFLSLDYDDYSYLCQTTWLTHLWEYVSSRGLDVTLTDALAITKRSSSDKFIMDILHKSTLTKKECIIANKVRIALRLLHLSDIVDGRGRRLLPDVRNGNSYRESKLEWPKQILLRKWLPIWHKACGVLQRYVSKHKIECTNMITTNQIWGWKTDEKRDYVSNTSKIFQRKVSKRVTYYTEVPYSKNIDATCSIPVDVTFHKGRPKLIYVYTSPLVPENGFIETIQRNNTTAPEFNWAAVFGEWDTVDEQIELELVTRIKNGKLLAGLDGSVTNGKGAYSFGLFSEESTPIYLHHGPIHGDSEQQNSTRSEMHGILGLLLYLKYLSTKYSLIDPYPTITIYGDNIESLRVAKVGPSLALKNTFSSDMDVAWELFYHVRNSPFKFQFEHVKSHQDDEIEYELLSIEAKINVQCDDHVTKYFRDPMKTSAKHMLKIPHYPNQQISLENPYTRITSSFRSNIQRYKVGHDAELQCARTWKVSPRALPLIDWENLRKEHRSKRGFRKFKTTKAIHRQWATMCRESRWKRAESALCPLCKQTNETISHVFQCTHDLVKLNRTKAIAEFKTSLSKYKSCPVLINHFCRVLHQYCGGFKVSDLDPYVVSPSNRQLYLVALAFREQVQKLGTKNMMFGILSKRFLDCQKLYFQHNNFGRNYTIDRWGRWIIRALQEFTNNLWSYRCEIMHEKEVGTMEFRLRSLAETWLIQLQMNPTILPIKSRYLLNKSPKYFRKGDLRSVNAWVRRMDAELRESKIESNTSDIRLWLNKKNMSFNTMSNNILQISDNASNCSESTCSDSDEEENMNAGHSTLAIRDLLLDVDSIPTYPNYKTYKQQIESEIPTLVEVFDENIVYSPPPSEDIYENVRLKSNYLRRILSDTTDEESSLWGEGVS